MRKLILKTGVFCMALTLLVFGIAFADPQSIPNGPWIQDEQTVKLEALTSMEELQKKLFNIYARSKERMEVEVAGETTLGFPI